MKSPLAAGFVTVALLSLSLNCASRLKQNFLDEPYRDTTVAASLVVTGIEVNDARPRPVDGAKLAIPSFTFKTVGDTISPPLTDTQEAVIREEVSRCAKGEGVAARVRITVNEGVKRFSMGFFHAREYAGAAVTVEILDGATVPFLFSASGEAHYELKSMSADTLFLEELYRKAFRTCVANAFGSIGKFLEKRVVP